MKDLDNIYTYHKPSALQNMKYDMVRAYAKQLADAIETVCPDSRERSLAHTNLEQATMWANASIARYKDPEPVASPFHTPTYRDAEEEKHTTKRETNFDRVTTDVKSLAMYLTDLPECGRGESCHFNGRKELPTPDDCFGCTVQWLYEEVKDK